MKIITRATLPALALLASIASAEAQTQAQTQDHQAHHPAGQAEQAPPAPAQAPGRPMGMMGGGMMGGGMMGGAGGMPMDCPMMGQNRDGAADGMRGMAMMGQGGMGMSYEFIEGRLAFLKAEIGITDEQAGVWNAFAADLRNSSNAHRTMREQMMEAKSAPSSWPERLERHARTMATRAEALKTASAAAVALYGVLTVDQRQKADALLSGPMGMPLTAH